LIHPTPDPSPKGAGSSAGRASSHKGAGSSAGKDPSPKGAGNAYGIQYIKVLLLDATELRRHSPPPGRRGQGWRR